MPKLNAKLVGGFLYPKEKEKGKGIEFPPAEALEKRGLGQDWIEISVQETTQTITRNQETIR